MSVDYMHYILLGVTRLLLRLWMQSTHHQELWYMGNQISIVDNRLRNIKPPDEIQHIPRSIELTVKFWKGCMKCCQVARVNNNYTGLYHVQYVISLYMTLIIIIMYNMYL